MPELQESRRREKEANSASTNLKQYGQGRRLETSAPNSSTPVGDNAPSASTSLVSNVIVTNSQRPDYHQWRADILISGRDVTSVLEEDIIAHEGVVDKKVSGRHSS